MVIVPHIIPRNTSRLKPVGAIATSSRSTYNDTREDDS